MPNDADPKRTTRTLLRRLIILAVMVLLGAIAFNLIDYGYLRSVKVFFSITGRTNIIHAVFYLGTYLTAVAALIVALFSRLAVARWITLLVVFVFIAIEVSTRMLTGISVGFSEVNTALNEISFAGQLMGSFTTSIIKAVLLSAVVAGIIYGAVRFIKVRFNLRWLLLVPLAAAICYIMLVRTVAMMDVYPSPIRIPVLAAYAALNTLDGDPRDPVEILPDPDASRPRVIIVIMDESITGSYLSINGYEQPTTPWLESIADQYLNLGIAAAASNLSAPSNLIVRTGIQPADLPDQTQRSLRRPDIFQYAKQAGYTTCYLDGQYRPNVLKNFLKPPDLDAIDEIYWAIADQDDPQRRHERDQILADKALQCADRTEPVFIWINKYGAHFHYETAYPNDQQYFTPTMRRGQSIDACTPQQVTNSYTNAVRWATDGFLEQFIPQVDLAETVVLYTSDHGQAFVEGLAPHGVRHSPPIAQADVPLLLWGDAAATHFPQGVDSVHDQTSHFQLFSSLIIFMGYDEDDVTPRYGQPLWGAPPTQREFLSGDIFGRGSARMNPFDPRTESVTPTTDN